MRNLFCYLFIFVAVYFVGVWVFLSYHESVHVLINMHFDVPSTIVYDIYGGHTVPELNMSVETDILKWEKAVPYHIQHEIMSYNVHVLYFVIMCGSLLVGLSRYFLRGDKDEK